MYHHVLLRAAVVFICWPCSRGTGAALQGSSAAVPLSGSIMRGGSLAEASDVAPRWKPRELPLITTGSESRQTSMRPAAREEGAHTLLWLREATNTSAYRLWELRACARLILHFVCIFKVATLRKEPPACSVPTVRVGGAAVAVVAGPSALLIQLYRCSAKAMGLN